MTKDALAAHARDEHGMSEATSARPLQAALTSAVTFAVGALVPVIVGALAPRALTGRLVTSSTIILLAVLGAVAARVGGAGVWRGALRLVIWGAVAMGAAALVGALVGVRVT